MSTDTTAPPVDVDKLLADLMPKITNTIRATLLAALNDRQSATVTADDNATRAAAIAACPDCDEFGQVDLGDAVANCRHPNLAPASQAAGDPAGMQRSFSEPLRPNDRREDRRP